MLFVMNYQDFFMGKKITQMGLGLLGRGVQDAEFLVECGADLVVTDLKSSEDLEQSVEKIKGRINSILAKNSETDTRCLGTAQFVLGEHRLQDFKDRDLILKGAGVPLDSPFIEEARKNKIPIEMDASLFAKLVRDLFDPERSRGAKLAPGDTLRQSSGQVTIVGVTGTRGKSTTTMLIYEIVKKALGSRHLGTGESRVFLAGNIKDKATLPLLKDVKESDYVVLELDSWQLQGFGESKISPHISVFTTFYPDHMNYYGGDMDKYFEDKANIFRFKNKSEENILISGEQALPFIQKFYPENAKKAVVARAVAVPKSWRIKLLGEHNCLNIACAIEAARAMKIDEDIIKNVVENFSAAEGRLQFVKEVRGIKIYNDNNSTTPEASIAALKAIDAEFKITNNELREWRKIILIMGGADKNLDMSHLTEEIPKYCKAVFLIPGTGTEKLRIRNNELGMMEEKTLIHNSYSIIQKAPLCKTLDEAVTKAIDSAESGDTVLFSPAFASFGLFKNEYDRGEQFLKIIDSV
ncbi:MAG: UDP-N-acetylmuramoylalanine--D-glutamate ligase [Candidatus Taylorbacteria bacterium RIFCSPLOWO2_01_FULL_43_44]|uniref:UDP-N-acetylmuramoylalanine--D-glutamate ligase n=1 Tax=Candidatus Taylorbacteria bacterium RIFCSPHIGHO2_02_FULL_43_32b TaxID=1802306 RepID=A0A1G2MHJ7_9BACT|nr:MAG: UDP-N-acetylmuramoylalanine--D-glutamate ligase [Candidatus Taylorbacteria bacterium RIFCSPHIGHO2_01_FULL_43_47]OHA23375.1 MAG: UDP-N-acetylmuramoylalanine--D-glutamate ligase [Candidatus Taylorbacteria bacterium RIFCSPHIGHO2_02_FULL_43_32b]OHA30355.1 MAG: UDP-N-acetylmuramoylalanine--D-glutamate ligase [Candidatus Taylorbacteria bacterium RIFCSPLOWO2_01_FULL_43_44]